MLHGDYLPEYTKEDVYRWMKKYESFYYMQGEVDHCFQS